MDFMMSVLGAVLAVAMMVAAQASTATGSIVGCVSDTMRQQLPRATVVVKGVGVQRITVADGAGCYALNDLPPASYRVTARLAGFDNVTHNRVVVAQSTATRLDFTTRPSADCECVHVAGSLGELSDRAEAVLHVRLSDSDQEPSTPQGYYRHSATVVTAVKLPAGPRAAPLFVLQSQASGAPEPYDVGQELVAFLESGPDAFNITNDYVSGGLDPSLVFLVQNDRIQRAPPEFSRYVGMPIGLFLEELRTFSPHK
jgi:hypothetical protein